jgi:protein SCO1
MESEFGPPTSSAQLGRVDFVSVDPQRDTPQSVNAYLDAFGPAFAGYTGDEAEIARLAASYRAAYRRVPLEGEDYTLDHTTVIYLIAASGEVRDMAAYLTPPERLDAQLKALLAE